MNYRNSLIIIANSQLALLGSKYCCRRSRSITCAALRSSRFLRNFSTSSTTVDFLPPAVNNIYIYNLKIDQSLYFKKDPNIYSYKGNLPFPPSLLVMWGKIFEQKQTQCKPKPHQVFSGLQGNLGTLFLPKMRNWVSWGLIV